VGVASVTASVGLVSVRSGMSGVCFLES
jgi:hypothetical protein